MMLPSRCWVVFKVFFVGVGVVVGGGVFVVVVVFSVSDSL